MSEFVRIGNVGGFPMGRGRAVDFEGERVAVFRTSSGFFAIGDTCRHMGASLAEGRLDGDVVTCPWHSWCYDVRTGKSDSRSGACVPVYDVKVEGGQVLLRGPRPASEGGDGGDHDDDGWMRRDPTDFFRKR